MLVIRKIKFVAVQAFTAALLSRHRFKNQAERSEEKSDERGRKPEGKKTQQSEEGRKFLSESFQENQRKEDPFLNHQFWATFNSPMTKTAVARSNDSNFDRRIESVAQCIGRSAGLRVTVDQHWMCIGG